jgi:rare lipoprotein A (peptidoglycan hydrolase)
MRRTIITIAALAAFVGLAEARPQHNFHRHHKAHAYTNHRHHLHFRGHHAHRHNRLARVAGPAATETGAGQSWFGTPEYPQARGAVARSRSLGSETASFGAASAAGKVVRASWYGGGERLSARTASGEHFNSGGLTAAHRSLPFGTRVQVTNVATGRAVVVRINDRGPFVGGRSLDLARGAAQAIGLHSTGSVRMVVLN